MSNHQIDPFDIISRRAVQNHFGTFWFRKSGNNVGPFGIPIYENLHRDNDLPAMIRTDGSQLWYKDGKQHRDNDLPADIHADGEQQWYKGGYATEIMIYLRL